MTDVIDSLLDLISQLKRCKPWIEAAIAKGAPTHTFDDFCAMVMQGRVKFWPLPNSFMATEVAVYPQERHLHVWLAGGDLDEIKAQQPELVKEAIAQGCSRITLSGRPGWIKALVDIGWRPAYYSAYFSISDAIEAGEAA